MRSLKPLRHQLPHTWPSLSKRGCRMPPPCICLYQPRLLLPYDEYRGPIASVALICSGVCVEALCFFFCFLWAVVCLHRGASKLYWALLPLPLQLFDFFVFAYGLWRVHRSNSWLLPSEKRLRAILLLGFFFRFCLCCLFNLYILEKVPLVFLLAASSVSYITGTVLNISRRDAYTWVRLQCWDLVVLLQLLTICLSSVSESLLLPVRLPIGTQSACVWPLWVLAACHLCCCMLLGLFLLRDVLLQQNAVTRVLVHIFEVHAVVFLLATISLSQWLSAHSRRQLVIFVSSAVASFFLFIVLSAFACICFIAHHSTAISDDIEQAGGGSLGMNGSPLAAPSAAAAAAAIAPPLMCDMKVTLERVSEHFYRIGAPLEKASPRNTLSDDRAATNDPVRPKEPLKEEFVGHPTAQRTRVDAQMGQQHAAGDKILPAPPIAAHAKGTEPAAAAVSPHNALSPPADAELCMICCNTKATAVLMYCGHGGLCFKCARTCFNRTGLCPTCRRPVKGVLEVQRPSSETQQAEHFEGVIRDVSR